MKEIFTDAMTGLKAFWFFTGAEDGSDVFTGAALSLCIGGILFIATIIVMASASC